MMNVFDAGKTRELLFSAGATLKRVFPTVLVYSRLPESYMLFAFLERRPLASVQAALGARRATRESSIWRKRPLLELPSSKPPSDALVFTDDHAPIEPMTRRMLAQEVH